MRKVREWDRKQWDTWDSGRQQSQWAECTDRIEEVSRLLQRSCMVTVGAGVTHDKMRILVKMDTYYHNREVEIEVIRHTRDL